MGPLGRNLTNWKLMSITHGVCLRISIIFLLTTEEIRPVFFGGSCQLRSGQKEGPCSWEQGPFEAVLPPF